MKYPILSLLIILLVSCNRPTDSERNDPEIEVTVNEWINTFNLSEDPRAVNVHQLFVSHSGYLFAGTDSGIYRTVNLGDKYKHLLTGSVRVLSFHETKSGMYAGTENDGVYSSTDDGVTWFNYGLLGQTINCMSSINDTLIAGTNSGVFQLDMNDDSWKRIGLNDTIVLTLIEDGNHNIFAGTEKNGIFSYNGKSTWKATKITSGAVVAMTLAKDNIIFFSLWGQGLFKMSNNGTTVIGTGLKNPNYIQSIAVDTVGHIFTANSQIGILASPDNGTTWSSLNEGLGSGEKKSIVILPGGDLFVSENPLYEQPTRIYKYSKTSYNYNK